MTEVKSDVERGLGRRQLIQRLGLTGLGAALWQSFGGSRPARASFGPAPGGRPTTSILQIGATEAELTSGPFQTFEAPAGTRIGLGLLTSGSTQNGPLPLIRGVVQAPTDRPEVGVFEPDPGVERAIYRLLGGIDTARPVEIFGLSTTVGGDGLEADHSIQIHWTAILRGDAAAGLGSYLERFHACVIGELGPKATFTGQLSYVELKWVG